MEKSKKKKQPNIKLRYNLLSALVYIIGIVLLLQLFNLQIINGATYRETSNTRLTRESTLYAARGSILDRNGNVLAETEMTFALELYKTKSETLNDTILKIINTLEENGDSYTDTFPITVDPFEYTFTSETKKTTWLETYNLDSDTTAEEAFYYFKDKYDIEYEDVSDVRKIIVIRYRISSEGYSSTKSLTISSSISRTSALIFTEQSDEYPGITVVQNSERSYPNGSLASHILGYVNSITSDQYQENKDNGYEMSDIYGQTGIEYVFENYLKGTNGVKQIDMSVDGEIVDEYIEEEAVQGSDVVLTIDANLQAVTEQALEDTINNIQNGTYGTAYEADAGAIVVMNVNTGEVLAMASYPDYDPNVWVGGISQSDYNYLLENNNALYNRAISGTYAPGSTFKMVTAIAGLETGVITTTEKINDLGTYTRYKDYQPSCWLYRQSKRTHGYLNVSGAIQHSCNYFFYEVGYRLGITDLVRYATYFGLGSKTGIELTSESSGTLASPAAATARGETWTDGQTLAAAIGQSYNAFTPLQMAKYISILANGGTVVNPTIVKTVINADGTEVSAEEINEYVNERLGIEETETEQLSFSEENLEAVYEGMKGVTSESGGTAYSIFKNFNIEIGGKTGSAQTGTSTNAWFVGFAPYDDPEIAIVVIIENGGTGTYACYAARDIIAQYFGMNEEEVEENLTAIPYTELDN